MSSDQKKKSTIGLKIISIILAVLLWFYVVNQGQLTARSNSVEVDLQYRHLAAGLSITAPQKVKVKMWGSFQESAEINAYVDLADLGKGNFRLPVNIEPVRGVMFTTVEPDKINVIIHEMSEYTVPVNYEITHNPPEGYQLLDIITVPDQCIIKGEEDVINKVKSVASLVNLGNVKNTGSFSAQLVARDEQGNYVNRNIRIVPEKVMVYVVVNEKRAFKQIGIKPLFSGKLEKGYHVREVTIEPDFVTLMGIERQLEPINELETGEIDINGKKESFSQEIDIKTPENIKVSPTRAVVTVEIEKIDSKEVEE